MALTGDSGWQTKGLGAEVFGVVRSFGTTWYNPQFKKRVGKTDGFLHPLGICRMRLHGANPFKEVGDQLSGYSQGVDQYTCMR